VRKSIAILCFAVARSLAFAGGEPTVFRAYVDTYGQVDIVTSDGHRIPLQGDDELDCTLFDVNTGKRLAHWWMMSKEGAMPDWAEPGMRPEPRMPHLFDLPGNSPAAPATHHESAP
jgi:hypothetical protein